MVNLDALASELGFVLKPEQKNAVESLLRGKDVFGVLPTGFGKSLIYQLFVLAKSRMPTTSSRPTIIVICPLKSIIEEQITSNEFNLSAAELRFDSDTINAVRNGEVQVVYAAAEQVLNEKFTSMLHEGRWLLFSSLVVPNHILFCDKIGSHFKTPQAAAGYFSENRPFTTEWTLLLQRALI